MRLKAYIAAGLASACISTAHAQFEQVPSIGSIPVLLYHLRESQGACAYNQSGVVALKRDLQALHAQGFTVVPVYWIAQWIVNDPAAPPLPLKPIGITFDDGPLNDYEGYENYCNFGPQKTSGYSVLRDFRIQYANALPIQPSPHASSFVLASREARRIIGSDVEPNDWWRKTRDDEFIEVYNHGADHEDAGIKSQTADSEFGYAVAASGNFDGDFTGKGNFWRTDSFDKANLQVAQSALKIQEQTRFPYESTGRYPDLFAYPFGHVPPYMRDVYFPYFASSHHTFAAFSTESRRSTKTTNRWSIPRFTHGAVHGVGQAGFDGHAWGSPSQFLKHVLRSPRMDLTYDGKSDALLRDESSGNYDRMILNGLSVTASGVSHYSSIGMQAVVDGDFDGDGISELVLRASNGSLYMVFFNSSGIFTAEHNFYYEPDSNWKIVGSPDIDGDGKSDLLWWNSSNGLVWGMIMDGHAIAAQGPIYQEPDTSWRIMATGGLRDTLQKNQVIWQNLTTGQVYYQTVTFNNPGFTTAGQMLYQAGTPEWRIVGAPDLNGDGRGDIFWYNPNTGATWALFMGDGPSIIGEGPVHTASSLAWKPATFGDFDGDGFTDILWRNECTGDFYAMHMRGATIRSEGYLPNQPPTKKLLGPWEYGKYITNYPSAPPTC